MLTVLLVEDNLLFRSSVVSALQRAGYDVRTTTDAASASAAVPDVQCVVVNLGSRSLDGIAVIRALKAQAPALPLLGYCGHAETDRWEAARTAGCDHIVANGQLVREVGGLVAGLVGTPGS